MLAYSGSVSLKFCLFVCCFVCLFFSFYNFGFWLKFWMFFLLLLFLLLFITLDFKNGCQYTSFCHGKAALLSILRVIIWCLILLGYSFPGIVYRELFTWQLYFIGKSKKAGKMPFQSFLLRIFIIIVCTNYNDVNLVCNKNVFSNCLHVPLVHIKSFWQFQRDPNKRIVVSFFKHFKS